MIIKICGITRRDDALEAIDAGATALGWNFYPRSPRYVTPEQAAEMRQGLPAGILQVGVFVAESAETIARIANLVQLDVVQIYGDSGELPLRVWKARRAGETLPHSGEAEAVLLDAAVPGMIGGTGQTFDWSVASNLPIRVVLAGGLDGSNVGQAIRAVHPWGVDACSRLESSPGIKDRQKVRQFVEAALSELL